MRAGHLYPVAEPAFADAKRLWLVTLNPLPPRNDPPAPRPRPRPVLDVVIAIGRGGGNGGDVDRVDDVDDADDDTASHPQVSLTYLPGWKKR